MTLLSACHTPNEWRNSNIEWARGVARLMSRNVTIDHIEHMWTLSSLLVEVFKQTI